LVKANQAAMATPLALKVIDSLTNRNAPVNIESMRRLSDLVAAFDLSSSTDSVVQKLKVSKAACKFASIRSAEKNCVAAVPLVRELHAGLALDLAALGHYADAAKHYASAPDKHAEAHAALVKQWAADGYAGERDLFGVRAVLNVLASGPDRAPAARRLYAALVANGMLSAASSERGAAPLGHFLDMVFELVDLVASYTVGKSGSSAAFRALLAAYRPSLAGRDGRIAAVAERVGQVHFGWKPPPGPMDGLMNMFKGAKT